MVPPSGSVGGAPPSVGAEGVHSGGSSVFPRQSWQVPQLLKQLGLGVHERQAVVLSALASVQGVAPLPLAASEPRKMLRVPPEGRVTAQHPKQSQPLGVSGPQTLVQVALWGPEQLVPLGAGGRQEGSGTRGSQRKS